jgi:hypothetical protein
MVVTRHIGLALAGTALLFTPFAQATFDFPSCVDNCISSSGCQPDSAKCMCKAAQGLLLDSVVSCMFFNCKSDLRNFEDAFLDPIEEGCEDSDRDIPSSKLKAAASLASSYISKLPASTTAKSTSAQPTSTPKTTAKPTSKQEVASSSSTATTEEEAALSSTSTSTSASERATEQSTSPTGQTTAAPTTRVTTPTAATQSSATSSQSPASDSGSGFDTNPFGSSNSAGSAIQPLLSLLGLPLALGLLTLR